MSKNSENNNIADDPHYRREHTHTRHQKLKRVQLKTSENAEINIVQRPSDQVKELKPTTDSGRLFHRLHEKIITVMVITMFVH